jgi:hypothetical protein
VDNCRVNHIRLTHMGTPDQAVEVLGVIGESKGKH